ncbi:hypothetical protein BASA60_001753 [Batrachochytrium salamandrivorans]|nr:hypothetical protein BASA60_001753 [Batrachochytrium salamandrivorans]
MEEICSIFESSRVYNYVILRFYGSGLGKIRCDLPSASTPCILKSLHCSLNIVVWPKSLQLCSQRSSGQQRNETIGYIKECHLLASADGAAVKGQQRDDCECKRMTELASVVTNSIISQYMRTCHHFQTTSSCRGADENPRAPAATADPRTLQRHGAGISEEVPQ